MAESITDLDALIRSTDSGKAYGLTEHGFVPKPLARLIEEKLAAARMLFGDDIDLTAGSAVRKILEIMCLEESRTWEHLGRVMENSSVVTAHGAYLSGLGEELGLPRPHHRAKGRVGLNLVVDLPSAHPDLVLDRGTRLLTSGGHDYFISQRVELTNQQRTSTVPVTAFVPGPEMNLDPSDSTQVLSSFNEYDARSNQVRTVEAVLGESIVEIAHTEPTTGGELVWADENYRDLLLSYPRNIWNPDAVRVTVALVPGVRQTLVKDLYGGLDIHQSIFGNFSFIERLFSEERSIASPYFFTIVVAKGEGAIWNGPGQLKSRVEEAVDLVRPIGIYPRVEEATEASVSLSCNLTVEGLPIPAGTSAAINSSSEVQALKQRIFDRVRRYVSSLRIAEQVLYAQVLWAIMEEPGVTNCTNLRLRRFPARVGATSTVEEGNSVHEVMACEGDLVIGESEVAVFVENPDSLRVI